MAAGADAAGQSHGSHGACSHHRHLMWAAGDCFHADQHQGCPLEESRHAGQLLSAPHLSMRMPMPIENRAHHIDLHFATAESNVACLLTAVLSI